ncbi:hypothetical protein P0082_01320 [Candidatus Haliotispira prima]|uniref:Lipoprotein n=1 Tax=Candidatus Haliotispira prima TaxID=3034016 RepID=A0ABY8MI13_9SPIO|nr:hypothetical protein P0082_01320 [Candidatus Haliotispira prima]
MQRLHVSQNVWKRNCTKIGRWLPVLLLPLLYYGCASAKVTQDLSGGAPGGIKWELVTVQADFVGKSDFLAISEIDGQKTERPLVFGVDVILLAPGEHELKIMLGEFENLGQLVSLDPGFSNWRAELGSITLKEPILPIRPGGKNGKKNDHRNTEENRRKAAQKGRNYLVASYDKIYSGNSNSPLYMQNWVVNYPRTVDADKKWSIESLDPETTELGTPKTEPETVTDTVTDAEVEAKTKADNAGETS